MALHAHCYGLMLRGHTIRTTDSRGARDICNTDRILGRLGCMLELFLGLTMNDGVLSQDE